MVGEGIMVGVTGIAVGGIGVGGMDVAVGGIGVGGMGVGGMGVFCVLDLDLEHPGILNEASIV
jgi:hypothetical protein